MSHAHAVNKVHQATTPWVVEEVNGDYSLFGAQVVESEKQYAAGVFDTTANMNATTYDASANGGSTAATSANLVVQSGVAVNGSGERISKSQIIYVPGQEGRAKFTAIFDVATAGAKQQVGFISSTDGAYLEKDGTGLSIVHVINSSVVSQIYSASWNGDLLTEFKKDGVVVPFTDTVGRVYRIRFGYLGYRGINYEVMSPDGRWVLMHRIFYDNETVPIFSNTVLDFRWKVIKTSGASNVTIKSGSFNVATVGERHSPVISADNSTTTPLTAGAVFTGDWVSHEGYVSIELQIQTDQVSASDGIEIQFSDRGDALATFKSKKIETFTASDVALGYKKTVFPTELSFHKLIYTNGGVNQGSLFIQPRIHSKALELPRGGLKSQMNASETALTTRGLVVAENDVGTFDNITRASSGGLRTAINQHEVETPIKSLSNFKVTRTTVGTSAVAVVAAVQAGRRSISIKALCSGSNVIYLYHSSAATTGNGFPLANEQSIDIELDDVATVWAIASAASQAVSVMEVY